MSKIEVRWTVSAETSWRKTFEWDDLPESIKAAIEERDGEQLPYDTDLELDLDDVDMHELVDYEEGPFETDYEVSSASINGLRLVSPTREELGIPGVVHVSEALDTVDQALEAGDAYRDAKEVE